MTFFIHSIQHFMLDRTIFNYIWLNTLYLVHRSVIYMSISIDGIVMMVFVANNSFTSHHGSTHNNISCIYIFINTMIYSMNILFCIDNFSFFIVMVNIFSSFNYSFCSTTTIHKHSKEKS